MKVEEKYKADYRVFEMLTVLADFIEAENQPDFAATIAFIWELWVERVPKELRQRAEFLVIDTYFKMGGDLRKGLRLHEESIAKLVGHEAHQEAMSRVRQSLKSSMQAAEAIVRGMRK